MKQYLVEKGTRIKKLAKGLIKNEKGDTNFISILIILGIVVLVAGVFIGFKDQIVEKVSGIVSGFTSREW